MLLRIFTIFRYLFLLTSCTQVVWKKENRKCLSGYAQVVNNGIKKKREKKKRREQKVLAAHSQYGFAPLAIFLILVSTSVLNFIIRGYSSCHDNSNI